MAPAIANWLAVCITSMSLVAVSGYAAALVWCLLHVDWRAVANWSLARKQTGRALAWCRAAMSARQGNDESPIDAVASHLVQQRKRETVRRAVLAMSPIFVAGDLLLIGGAAGLLPFASVSSMVSTHVPVSATVVALAALCIFRKDQPTKGVMVAAHVVGFGSLMLTLHSFGDDGLSMLFDRSTSFGIRCLFAMTLCDIRLTVFCNSLYAAFMMYKFTLYASSDQKIAQFGYHAYAYQEIGTTAGIVIMHIVLSWRLQMDTRAAVEAKMSPNGITSEPNQGLIFADDSKMAAGMMQQEQVRLEGLHVAPEC